MISVSVANNTSRPLAEGDHRGQVDPVSGQVSRTPYTPRLDSFGDASMMKSMLTAPSHINSSFARKRKINSKDSRSFNQRQSS